MSPLPSKVPDEFRYAGLDISITPDMMMQTYVLTTVIGGNKYGWVVTEQEIEDRGLSGVCQKYLSEMVVKRDIPLGEITSEPLVGYRWWRIDTWNEDTLQSMARGFRWEGPIVRADGIPSVVRPPVCSWSADMGYHGIYSLKFNTIYEVTEDSKELFPIYVLGLVDNLGVVIEHERGYRAEKVRVKELWIGVMCEELKGPLSRKYDCPVNLFYGAEEWTSEIQERFMW